MQKLKARLGVINSAYSSFMFVMSYTYYPLINLLEKWGFKKKSKIVWIDEYGDTYPTRKKLMEAIGAVDKE